jgi:hypothetical protein
MIYSGDLDERRREIVDEVCQREWTDEDRSFVEEVDAAAENIVEWQYGIALYEEDDMEDYAREYVADVCGELSRDSWLWYDIDWGRVAERLASDMTTVVIEGTTYYCHE